MAATRRTPGPPCGSQYVTDPELIRRVSKANPPTPKMEFLPGPACATPGFGVIWSMAKAALSILLFHLGLCASAQPFPTLHWSLLTEKDGLSCDKATAIGQDGDGIIWVATN